MLLSAIACKLFIALSAEAAAAVPQRKVLGLALRSNYGNLQQDILLHVLTLTGTRSTCHTRSETFWGLGQGYAGTAVKQCRVGEVQWNHFLGFGFRIGDLLVIVNVWVDSAHRVESASMAATGGMMKPISSIDSISISTLSCQYEWTTCLDDDTNSNGNYNSTNRSNAGQACVCKPQPTAYHQQQQKKQP